jgi:hypothetical protein
MAMHLTAATHALLAGLMLAPPVAQAQAPSAFDGAMQAYSMQHFRQAFDGLAPLADGGNADAARIALLMVAHGTRLFGQRFDIAAQRRARWLDIASAALVQDPTASSSEPRNRPGNSVNMPATTQPPT